MNGPLQGERPHCAVIIPVGNGTATLARCLDGLAEQRSAPPFETVVVADGAGEAVGECVAAWQRAHPHQPVHFIAQPGAGLAAARNRGAQAASAARILFIDADCIPTPGWVAAFAAALDDEEVAGAKGPLRTAQRGLVPQFVQAEYADRYDHIRERARIDFIDNYSAAYRRDVFLTNGGFDTNFGAGEDQELSFRLAEKGYRMVFVPEAAVVHLHDTRFMDYVRRKAAMGFWKAPLTSLHPERMVQDTHTPQVLKVQIVVASLLVLALPPALLASLWPPLQWVWLLAAGLLLFFLLTTLPFLRKLAAQRWALVPFGVVMLMARALALGTGYVAGTVHFAGALPGARRPLIPGWKRAIKRSIDIAGALIGLAVAIPLVAVAAIAIKLDSPGPVFYWQVRIGENGRPFRIVKLRSMVADAETRLDALVDMAQLVQEPAFKLANDPRVTRVGHFLRRTSLDEVPQFYNVLVGDMSLVGPRPEEARVVQLYTDDHRRRLAVKPGLTGPMQVSGRGSLSFAARLQLEIDYIEHYSLWRDFDILLRTVPAVWHGKGAR